jgi:hypothetical protein
MGVLTWPRTGDLVRDLETHMRRERELGVWGFPHYVRYLRAIIVRLTPQPHRCTEAVLDAAAQMLAANTGGLLHKLITTPPGGNRPARMGTVGESRAHVSRLAANAICEVIGCWAGHDPQPGLAAGVKFRDTPDDDAAHHANERAKSIVRTIESAVLDLGMTVTELFECAVEAFSEDEVDPNRRDAAVAAMQAGHFQLGHEIITDAPRDKN